MDDHPGMSPADQLRLIIKKTLGYWHVQTKARQLLARANAEGNAGEKLSAFWKWIKNTFERERSFKVNNVEEYLKKWYMDDRGNPADAINDLLWMHDLTWKDVSDDERLQGVVANTVVSDIKYLDPSEIFETRPRTWETVLTQKWERCRKPNNDHGPFNGGPWIMKAPKGKWSNQRNRGRHY